MFIRIEPDIENTELLLTDILGVTLSGKQQVSFLVPAGQANYYVYRIRVMLSRKRKKMYSKGNASKQFTLRATSHTEHKNGKRFDCIVMWCERRRYHDITESIERELIHAGESQ